MQPSEVVADGKHVQIEAGIVLADAGVGHVLEAVGHADLFVNPPCKSGVTGKLKRHPEVYISEFMLAQNRRAGTGFKCQREIAFAQNESWSQRADKAVFATPMEESG